MRALAAILLLVPSARAEIDETPARVALAPLPAGWRILDVGPCEKAGSVPCAIAPFWRVRHRRSQRRPARIVFAGPEGGAPTQVLGPPFDGQETISFDKAPLGHLAMSSDYLMFVPRDEPRYDPRLVSPGPRLGWGWGSGNPKAPPMPEEVALAVAGELYFRYVYVVHREPRTRNLEYYHHPAELKPPAVPLRPTDRVVALAVEVTGLLHALVLDGTRIVYVTNRRDDVREAVADAGDPGTIHAAIVADARGGAHVAYRDGGTGGVQYWTNPNGTWTKLLVAKGEGLGGRLGVAVEEANVPHVIYSAPEGLRYMTWGNGAWVRHAVTADGPVAGCAIASDGQGIVHICVADGRRGLLRYATNLPAEAR